MNVRSIVRKAIQEYINISSADIENAVQEALENLDIGEKVQDAVECALPEAISEVVESILDD